MRFLGIDFGTRKIGLAVSDEEGKMAFPLRVVAVTPNLLDDVTKIITAEHIDAVIIGESRDFNGKENPLMEHIHAFKEELEKTLSLPVHLEPEVLSSQEAARFQGRTSALDASAATIILQSFLDKHKEHE